MSKFLLSLKDTSKESLRNMSKWTDFFFNFILFSRIKKLIGSFTSDVAERENVNTDDKFLVFWQPVFSLAFD